MEERILALAGMFQAAELVYQIARHGRCDEEPLAASIGSVLKLDAASTAEVYGGLFGARTGLQVLLRELGGVSAQEHRQRQAEIARYVLGIALLEARLRKRPDMLDTLRAGIERATAQAGHFSVTHPNVLANLAGLYSETLSTFSYRIHVLGEPAYLQPPGNVNKVRALLLAGVRSAVLWRQKGGRRWQLLFSRKKILRGAKALLRSA
jgi:high frequency lysogenization protein